MALPTPAFNVVALWPAVETHQCQLAIDKKYLMISSWLLLLPFSISRFRSTSFSLPNSHTTPLVPWITCQPQLGQMSDRSHKMTRDIHVKVWQLYRTNLVQHHDDDTMLSPTVAALVHKLHYFSAQSYGVHVSLHHLPHSNSTKFHTTFCLEIFFEHRTFWYIRLIYVSQNIHNKLVSLSCYHIIKNTINHSAIIVCKLYSKEIVELYWVYST